MEEIVASQMEIGNNVPERAEPARESCSLIRAELDGREYWLGTVQFEQPASFKSVLMPFVKVLDAKGNRYHVRGLVGLLTAIHSAKVREKKAVICTKSAENEFSVVRWM